MPQFHFKRALRAALSAAIALPAFLVGQTPAHAIWVGYTDAPTTYPGISISDANPAGAVVVTPSMTKAQVAAAINDTDGGAVNSKIILFETGVYKNVADVIVLRDGVTLRAKSGATVWFDGSIDVPSTEWTQETSNPNIWWTDTTPTGTQPNAGSVFEWPPLASIENTDNTKFDGTISDVNPLADDGEMAFDGGVPQVQVGDNPATTVVENGLSLMGPNKFYVDRALDRLYVYSPGAAPTNITLARHDTAFIIGTEAVGSVRGNVASDVVLQGLNFRYFVGSGGRANGQYKGPVETLEKKGNPGTAVGFNGGPGRVDRCVFFWNAHGGLDLNTRAIVERSQFVSNGWNAMGTNASNGKIRGNYIAYNNAEGFNGSWSAAGIKLGTSGFSTNVDIYDNEICFNRAVGVWFDGFANNIRVFRNYVHDNTNNAGGKSNGIFFEISKNCTAAFNIISGNGVGLFYAAAPDGKAYNNTFYDNKQHLWVNDQTGRADETVGGDDLSTPAIENEIRSKVAALNNIFMGGGTSALDAYVGGSFQGKGGTARASILRFDALDYNVYRNTPGQVFDWRKSGGGEITFNTLALFKASTETGSFEDAGGLERTVAQVFLNVGSKNFRVPGSDAGVATGGAPLPDTTDGLSADIRGLLRDKIAFVPDALTNARCDLADNTIDSIGAVPTSGQYRGALEPADANTTGGMISEFRFHGANGAADEFVEIHNPLSTPLNVGSWMIRYQNAEGLQTATIPENTVIKPRGHFLFTGSTYSLAAYGGGDAAMAGDALANSGVSLHNAAGAVQEAVGFASSASTLREGAGLPAAPTANGQYAFARDYLNSGYKDTAGNSSADFLFVSTSAGSFAATDGSATPTTITSMLGAPSPKGSGSPLYVNNFVTTLLLDGDASQTAAPNRVRTGTGDSGSLLIRRTLVNKTGRTLNRVRFSVTKITSLGSPILPGNTLATQADVRLISSSNEVGAGAVTLSDGVNKVDVFGTSLEAPSIQSPGGGVGASTHFDAVLATPLPNGESRSYSFLLSISKAGNFTIFLNIEALPSA